jgi:hypothetical protein
VIKYASRIEGAQVGMPKYATPLERDYKNEVGETRK